MAYEHRPGSFSLFKNDKKGNEKAPDYSGTGMDMDGQMIRVAAWLKDGQRGKFMSCKIEPAREQQDAPPPVAKPKPAARQDDPFGTMDDDLPFSNPYRGRLWYVV
jgi:hypothetical protein